MNTGSVLPTRYYYQKISSHQSDSAVVPF